MSNNYLLILSNNCMKLNILLQCIFQWKCYSYFGSISAKTRYKQYMDFQWFSYDKVDMMLVWIAISYFDLFLLLVHRSFEVFVSVYIYCYRKINSYIFPNSTFWSIFLLTFIRRLKKFSTFHYNILID